MGYDGPEEQTNQKVVVVAMLGEKGMAAVPG